jgi:hypothetical protein
MQALENTALRSWVETYPLWNGISRYDLNRLNLIVLIHRRDFVYRSLVHIPSLVVDSGHVPFAEFHSYVKLVRLLRKFLGLDFGFAFFGVKG